jgi:glycosyltransferase involved in cell wall biosynthesis
LSEHLASVGDFAVDLVVASDPAFAARPAPRLRVVRLRSEAARSRSLEILQTAQRLRSYLNVERPALFLSMGNHDHLAGLLGARGFRGASVYRISNALRRARGAPRTALGGGVSRALVAQALAARASHLVTVSEALELGAIARAARRGRVTRIPNGVDIHAAREAGAQPCPHPWFEERTPVIVSVGRLHPQKNLRTLVRAFARARRECATRLVVLGAGSAPRRAELVGLARELGVEEHMSLPGVVANVFPYLKRAAVFALPSWWEGSSNALLEALASEVPIVASRTAGDAEAVLDGGGYGCLFAPDSADELAAALLRQLSPDAIRPRGRALAYSLEASHARYEACIRRLIDGEAWC